MRLQEALVIIKQHEIARGIGHHKTTRDCKRHWTSQNNAILQEALDIIKQHEIARGIGHHETTRDCKRHLTS